MSRWENFKTYLNNKYRLVVLNDMTLEERLSFRLSRMNVYAFISTISVIYAALIIVVIVNTPLKEYIPGYQDVNIRRDVTDLSYKADSLEKVVNTQALFIQNIQHLLNGDLDLVAMRQSDQNQAAITDTADFSGIDLDKTSEEDSLLRLEVENQSSFSLNNDHQDKKLKQKHFIKPVDGFINRGFDPAIEHFGLDLGSTVEQAPVKTVLDGIVILSEWTYETGYVIAVQHSDNLISFYKHNSVLLKKLVI